MVAFVAQVVIPASVMNSCRVSVRAGSSGSGRSRGCRSPELGARRGARGGAARAVGDEDPVDVAGRERAAEDVQVSVTVVGRGAVGRPEGGRRRSGALPVVWARPAHRDRARRRRGQVRRSMARDSARPAPATQGSNHPARHGFPSPPRAVAPPWCQSGKARREQPPPGCQTVSPCGAAPPSPAPAARGWSDRPCAGCRPPGSRPGRSPAPRRRRTRPTSTASSFTASMGIG